MAFLDKILEKNLNEWIKPRHITKDDFILIDRKSLKFICEMVAIEAYYTYPKTKGDPRE